MSDGIVYVLINEAMPGYVKVGKTTDLAQRIKQLYGTPVPLPFECFYAARVADMGMVEKHLHDAFDHNRVAGREFFRIAPERIVAALQLAPHTNVTPSTDYVENEDDRRALNEARTRRAIFNFRMVDIKPGAILSFTRDDAVTAKVVDDRLVEFEGEVLSLSAAARGALAVEHQVQGPVYWKYEGETLDERRTRMEQGE